MAERRKEERKSISYYMQLKDEGTQEIVGHLADLSSGGFKIDSQIEIPPRKDFHLHMELTSEVSNKPFMTFYARSKWCQTDPLDPFVYNVGFQFVNIAPSDLNILIRMLERYGSRKKDDHIDKRRSNLW